MNSARLTQLKAPHTLISDQEKTLQKPRFQRPFNYWFGIEGLRQDISTKKHRLFQLTDRYLLETNAEYRKLAEQNLVLISTDSLFMKVASSAYSLIHSYATSFSGKILDNGVAYCNSTTGNIPLEPFSQYKFPSKLIGTIDQWGNVNLRAAETGMAFIQTLPVSYTGTISNSGEITLIISETESDILSGGKLMIDKLIARILSGTESLQFAQNRNRMEAMVNDRIKSLNKSN